MKAGDGVAPRRSGLSTEPAEASRHHYPTLQLLRGVAALGVLLYHLGTYAAQRKYFGIAGMAVPFAFGHAGVEFFFVLSGFIIARVHLKDVNQPQRLPAFLARRALRIYPTYWLVFCLVYLGALATGNHSITLPQNARVLVESLALLPQDPAVVGGTGAPVIWVAWTLQYEMYFYVWAALAVAGWRWLLLGLVALGITLLSRGPGPDFMVDFLTRSYIGLFLAGSVSAWLAGRIQLGRLAAQGLLAAGLAVFAFAAAADIFHALDGAATTTDWAYGPGAALIVFAAVKWEDAVRPAMLRVPVFWQRLGDASYSIYLVHQPLIGFCFRLVQGLGLSGLLAVAIAMALGLLAGLGAGLVIHLVFERPVLLRATAWLKGRAWG